MSDTDEVLAQRHEAVLLLTLNRPARLNAWTPAMRDHYVDLLAEADRDEDVRAVVVTGSGRAFCSGSDIASPPEPGGSGTGSGEPQLAAPMRMRKPVIAAINGPVAGSGLAAALFADIRFAAAEARFTTAFSRNGHAAEHGVAWLLPKLVGLGAALDLLLAARTLRGEEAREVGLVDRVVAGDGVLDSALAYAHVLATECSPVAVATIKRQVYAGLDSGLEVAARDPGSRMITALERADGADPPFPPQR